MGSFNLSNNKRILILFVFLFDGFKSNSAYYTDADSLFTTQTLDKIEKKVGGIVWVIKKSIIMLVESFVPCF